MKRVNVLMVIIICIFFSCGKTEVDFRDKWEGEYVGDISYSFFSYKKTSFDTVYPDQHVYVIKCFDSNCIILRGLQMTISTRVLEDGIFNYYLMGLKGDGRLYDSSIYWHYEFQSPGFKTNHYVHARKVSNDVSDSIRREIISEYYKQYE